MKTAAVGAFIAALLFAAALVAQEEGGIKWEESLDKAFEKAKKESKPVLADFTRKTG